METSVRPVAVMPLSSSAVEIAGPTFQKSTSMKTGLVSQVDSQVLACRPRAPVLVVELEFVVAMSETSGIEKEDVPVSRKWFISGM